MSHDKLVEIDNYCNTYEFRTKLFGNNANKYEYQPIVRFPSEEDVNNQYYRPPYIKVKLVLDQISSKPYVSVFNNQDGKRESVEVKNFEELLNHMKLIYDQAQIYFEIQQVIRHEICIRKY